MLKYLLLLNALLSSCLAFNQSITWDALYNHHKYDLAKSIKQTSDNGFIVANQCGNNYDTTNTWIIKLNELGDTVWSKTYNDTIYTSPSSIIQSSDGNYVITGYKSLTPIYYDNSIYVFKINESGDILWEYEYEGNNQLGVKVIETFNSDIVILGADVAMGLRHVILIRLNQNGELIWDHQYYFQYEHTIMKDFIQTKDSGFALVGGTIGDFDLDIWLMKTDQKGDSIWNKKIDIFELDLGYSIIQLADESYIISGVSNYDNGSDNLLTYKLSKTGNVIWSKNIYTNSSYTPCTIIETADGSFLSSGRIWQQTGVRGLYIYKQNAQGDTIWTKTYQKGFQSFVKELILTSDEGIVICGSAYIIDNNNMTDSWILKLNKAGELSFPEIQNYSTENINIYPNPATDFISCNFNFTQNLTYEINLYSINGLHIKSEVFHNNLDKSLNINVSELKSGVYILKVSFDNQSVSKKILIR